MSANKKLSNLSALKHHNYGYITSENDTFSTLQQQSNAIKIQIKYLLYII